MSDPGPVQPCDLTRLRLLIVDDEPMLRSVITDFLELLGVVEHKMAGDGAEALKILRAERFDCVVSDIRMPEMELEDLLPITAREFPDLIVIATSGFSDLHSAQNILRKGAHDFLGKPLNLDALEEALLWVVARSDLLVAARAVLAESSGDATAIAAGLSEAVESLAGPMAPFMGQATRVAALAAEMETTLEPSQHLDLVCAAALYPIGLGRQVWGLCMEGRTLDPDELDLVRVAAPIGGGLIERCLARPDAAEAVRHHLESEVCDQPANTTPGWLLAGWLAWLRRATACLRDRPDRPAMDAGRVRAMFEQRRERAEHPALDALLDQWPKVVEIVARD